MESIIDPEESMMVNQWNHWWQINGNDDVESVESMMVKQWNQWWRISGINDGKSIEYVEVVESMMVDH